MSERQAFRRESADTRREALVVACAQCLAKLGAQGTSVRTICLEAGVSPGLLRHYFGGIGALIEATYRATGEQVANALEAAVEAVSVDQPRARLLAFVTANFRPPVADPQLLATWLAFWSLARNDAALGTVHDDIYADNRRYLEALIAACPGAPAPPRMAAIGLTAMIDGLWLELTLGNPPFSVDEATILAEDLVASLWRDRSHDRPPVQR